ncbi:hypothetical protein quinque_010864 [Culex quinquefasciatus]
MLDREQEKCEEFTCQLTNLNAQLGAVAQEVTRLTDDQEELLTAHEAIKSKRDSLAEQVEELTESMAVLEEDRDTLRELAIGEKVTNRTLEGALSEKGKVVEQAKSVEQLQVEKSTLEATKEIEDLMKDRRKSFSLSASVDDELSIAMYDYLFNKRLKMQHPLW